MIDGEKLNSWFARRSNLMGEYSETIICEAFMGL
jgi:hypothetical protein